MSNSSLHFAAFPDSLSASAHFAVRVDGQSVFVGHTGVAAYVPLVLSGPAQIEIESLAGPVSQVTTRPLRRGVGTDADGSRVRLTLPGPMNLSVEIAGLPPLYLFCSAPDPAAPSPQDPNVLYFEGGKRHDVGLLTPTSGQTVYLAPGAVVRGRLLAEGVENVSVRGPGVWDGGQGQGMTEGRTLLFRDCRNIRVEDITIVRPTVWMVVLEACTGVYIRNLHEIGEVIGSDGIDVVSSRDVLIEDCFLRNNDDCIVVKAYRGDAERITARRCVLANERGGNALEIGHELPTAHVRDITFRDCDVLHVHGYGAAFAIHNADTALVSDILFEDIHVEHHYDKLVDLRVIQSRWGRTPERGQVRNVRFRNIHVLKSLDNPGYSTSLIGGFDAGHTVEDVVFEDFFYGDVKVRNGDDLDLFTRHAHGIVFR